MAYLRTEVIGLAAALLTTASFVPQAIEVLRTGDTRAISLGMYLMFTSGSFLWLIYGVCMEPQVDAAIRSGGWLTIGGTHMQVNLCKALVAVAVLAAAPPAFADAITVWNENAVTIATPRMSPPAAQRAVAMVQVAMFDAVNSIERRYRPYLAQVPAAPTASKEAAAAAAAGAVLAGLFPNAEKQTQDLMASYLAALPEGEAKAEGVVAGGNRIIRR